MCKKLLSMALALVMCISLCIPAMAAENQISADNQDCITNRETMYVQDDEGKIIELQIEERTYYSGNRNGWASLSSSPSIGEKKSYTIYIKNSDVCAAATIGASVSTVTTKAAAKLAAKAVAEKVAQKFIPGLDIAVAVVGAVAAVNELVFDNNGFVITVDLEYTSHYLQREGYYIEGWDFKGASIGTY